jgi:hypothetical protein
VRFPCCAARHEGSLTIKADRVDFYASRGKVLGVRLLSSSEIEVELETRLATLWTSV